MWNTSQYLWNTIRAVLRSANFRTVKMSIRDADIGKVHNQVKADWYLEINPNGKIPTIKHGDIPVFETSAILNYLAQVYDKDRQLSHDQIADLKGWAREQSWLLFAVSGQGDSQRNITLKS